MSCYAEWKEKIVINFVVIINLSTISAGFLVFNRKSDIVKT